MGAIAICLLNKLSQLNLAECQSSVWYSQKTWVRMRIDFYGKCIFSTKMTSRQLFQICMLRFFKIVPKWKLKNCWIVKNFFFFFLSPPILIFLLHPNEKQAEIIDLTELIFMISIVSSKFLGVRINLLHAVYVISGNFLAKVPQCLQALLVAVPARQNWQLKSSLANQTDCNICTVDCKNGGCSWNTMFGTAKFCPKIVGIYS